jgi:CelD/BcsL family acetyltransferase involved in cellulose biosynthesis
MPDRSPVDVPKLQETAHLRHEIRVIEVLEDFKIIRREWDMLAATAEDYPLSATYQYCELAAGLVLAKGGTIAVAMVYDNHDLLAIWPLAIHREGPLLIAKTLTCGSDEEYGGPLVKGEASRVVVTVALSAAMRVRADILEVRWVQDGGILQESLESAPQSWLLPLLPKRSRGLAGYSIRLHEYTQWDEFTATLSKKLRADLRRSPKRLSAKGHLEFGWCTTVDDAEAVLTWLFENKRRWAETRGLPTKYLMDDQIRNQVRNFFIALAHRTDLSTTPLVAFVKVNGFPVAASVNLVGPRSFEYFITTYDEAFSIYSVGNLLIDFIVKWSHANGHDFDFRILHADYKARWADRETFHQTRIIFLSVRGRLLEISLLAAAISRVGHKFRRTTVDVVESIKGYISRSLMPSRSSG